MATGHEICTEDALLGLNDASVPGTSTASIFGAIDKLQSTMDCVSAGINKMGDAFAVLAATPRETPKSIKRKLEMEEGSDDHSSMDDYDDEDEIKSLLNTSSGEKSQSSSNKEEDYKSLFWMTLNCQLMMRMMLGK